MTTAELYRALADEIERREALEELVQQLKAELAEARAKVAEAEPKKWYSSREAALYLCLSESLLEKDRIRRPPMIPFCKDGPRRVTYARADLDQYKLSRMKGRKKNPISVLSPQRG